MRGSNYIVCTSCPYGGENLAEPKRRSVVKPIKHSCPKCGCRGVTRADWAEEHNKQLGKDDE